MATADRRRRRPSAFSRDAGVISNVSVVRRTNACASLQAEERRTAGWGGGGGGEILGEITRAGVTELRITRDDRTRGGRYKGAVGWEGAKNEIQRGLNPIIK